VRQPGSFHFSPLVDLLAVLAVFALQFFDGVGPPRGLRATLAGSCCSCEPIRPPPLEVVLSTAGVHRFERRNCPGPPVSMETVVQLLRTTGANSLQVHVEDEVELEQLIAFLDQSAARGFRNVRVVPGSAAEPSCLRRAGVVR
jgi:hypothetical protein